MFRAIPSVNKIISQKEKEKNDEKLILKLNEIRKSQSTYNFRINQDKIKLYKRNNYNDIARNMEIRRENLILGKKIKGIGRE